MSAPNGLVYGYHGTTAERADEILKTGLYKPSTGDGHWLGSDLVYFYDDPDLAGGWGPHWAVPQAGGGRPALLRSTIELGNCLDLTQSRYKVLVARLGETLLKHMSTDRIESMNQNHGLRELDSFVLDQMRAFKLAAGEPFSTVRAICAARNGTQPKRIFPPEGPLYSVKDLQSWFDHHDHTQIGVADQAAILETVRLA